MEVEIKDEYKELVENLRRVKRERAERLKEISRKHFKTVKKWFIP